MKGNKYIGKIFSVVTILIYSFVMIFGYLPYFNLIDTAYAEQVSTKDNLVLVFVDSNVYNNYKADISWYANYIQQANKNTKAIVFPIDTNLVKSTDIQKVIKNLYFQGEKNKTSFLKAIVLIGNVPLPVVNKNGFIYSSIYPYVDVVKPSFKYDGKYFSYTGNPSNVEIAHGIIKFNQLSDYHKYFEKLRNYAQNPSNFVDKKFYYDNFVSLGESLNTDLLKQYLNKLIFAENIIYNKISPLLLEYFDNQLKGSMDKIANETIQSSSNISISGDSSLIGSILVFDSNQVNNFSNFLKTYNEKVKDYTEKIGQLINQAKSVQDPYWQMPTKNLESSLVNFFKNFSQLFGNEYSANISDNIKATGRYDLDNTVSNINTIDLKDTLGVNFLKSLNTELESGLDQAISQNKYFMYYPLMVKYTNGDNNGYTDLSGNSFVSQCESTYETFFFGKNVFDINKLSDVTIYRGTYQNLTGLSAFNYPSRGLKSNFSNLGIFSYQVEANRAYNNMTNASKDGSNFQKSCSKSYGACIDLGRAYNSESISHWAKRIYGGYSPLNVKTDAISQATYKLSLNYENYKYAWHPIETFNKDGTLFDLGGSVYTDEKFVTDNIFDVILKYASVWKTNWYTKGYIYDDGYETCSSKYYADGSSKVAGTYYDFFKNFSQIAGTARCSGVLFSNVKQASFSLTRNILTITKYMPYTYECGGSDDTKTCCTFLKDKVTTYKFIDTRIKHTAPTDDILSKLNVATWARPVDERNYISFLGVGGDTVKLDYPDIFSVNVYYQSGGKLVLKTPEQITQSIKDYLKNLVNDYNSKLQNQLNKKDQFYNSYKSAWDKISNSTYKPHSYSLLNEDYLINKLGEKKIAQAAEILYYLNLGWKEKPVSSTLSGELQSLYKNFDIYQKISYVVKNYLDTKTSYNINGINLSHNQLNFPGKPTKGYEAGVIFSKNSDNAGNIKLKNNENNLIASNLLSNGLANTTLPIEQAKQECGRPLGEGVILWEWPSAFMCRLKETLSKPFKIGSTADCSANSETFSQFKNNLQNIKFGTPENDLNFSPHKGVSLQQYLNLHPELKQKYDEWLKLKKFVDTNYIISTDKSVYDYSDISGNIQIQSSITLNPLENPVTSFYIQSTNTTGNCLYIKTLNGLGNTCEGVNINLQNLWKVPFYFYNPITKEGRYYAYKTGQRTLVLKFCDKNNICYTKPVYFSKNPGDIKYVKIKPFSSVMVYGGENPFVITAYDSLPEQHVYQNVVKSTYYTYKLSLQPEIGVISDGVNKGQPTIDFNFNKSLLFAKSTTEPISSVDKFKIVGKLSSEWNVLSGKVLSSFSSSYIYITSKQNLTSNEVKVFPSMTNINLPDDPSYFFSGSTYDKNKIWKIKIKPIVADHILKTPLKIFDDTNHFIIGTYQNGKFVKNNDFLITGDNGITVYVVPTYKTGPFSIKVKIPGINPYEIKGNINKFPIKALYVKLDKYQANPNEVIKGKIFGVDKFGNLDYNLNGLKIIKSSGFDVVLNGNNLKIKGTKTGFIKFEYKNKLGQTISQTVYIGISSTFIPLDRPISVMYLTLFGYDWGKYAPKIMANSDKNLAITTTLVDPTNLKHYDYIIFDNLSLNQPGNIYYSGGNLIVDFEKIKVNTNQNILSNISYIKSSELILNNGVYYVPEKLDSIITSNYINNGQLYINEQKVADFKQGFLTNGLLLQFDLQSSKKTNLGVFDVIYKNKLVGKIYIKGNLLNLSSLKTNLPVFTKVIYGSASTNGSRAFGISISDIEYTPISKNLQFNVSDDKGLSFRSNFKNISNFAAGMDVGDATKPFENEFMVNFGDPFVRKISENSIISQVKMSTTYGYNVYSDIAGGIKKVIPLDFNNDGQKDLIIVYNDNRLRFLKNYGTSHKFEDLGNLMVLAKSIKDAFAGDYNGDGYEDLYVIFNDGTIRVYKNNQGEFDVNGTPVCLDLAKSDPYKLKYTQIFFKDMDNDKKTDIVVNDLVGNIKIFYGGTYLSSILTGCDTGFKSRLKQQLVKSYAIKVNSNQKFADDGYIYLDGLNQSADTLLKDNLQQAFKNGNFNSIPSNSNITPENYLSSVQSAGQDKFAYQAIPVELGPSWLKKLSGDTIKFKKITFLTGSDPIKIYKTMEDLNGGYLENQDKVKITVHIEDPTGKKYVYLEQLKGPFGVVTLDGNQVLLKTSGISDNDISFPKRYNFLLKVEGNKSATITYYAIYQGTSQVKIKVGDWDNNKVGDIKVFVNNGCIKGYEYFQGQSGGIPMSFSYHFENLKTLLENKLSNLTTNKELNDITQQVSSAKNSAINGDTSALSNLFNEYFGDTTQTSNPWYVNGISFQVNIGPDVNKIRAKVNQYLQGLCNGFSIGKSNCGGIDVPCNFAFFAPGIINACGCPLGTDPGTPVFWYPGTFSIPLPHGGCAGPIPMPWFRTIKDPPLPTHAPIICMGPKFPSFIRIYLAPTLTKSLGIAVCFGNYKVAMHAPPAPLGTIVGNCIVAAKPLKTSDCNKSKAQNADNQEDDWMLDLDNGVCNQLPFSHGIYPLSPLTMPVANNFFAASINPAYQEADIGGIINFDMTAHKINSLADAQVLMQGGIPFHLKTETGTFKGIIQCIIKKWINKQIEFLISQLTNMTIYVVYPNIDDLIKNIKATKDRINNIKYPKFKDWNLGVNTKTDYITNSKELSDTEKKIISYFPSKEGLNNLSANLSNPFKRLKLFLEQIPLVSVTEKTVTLNIPWIGKDEVARQITYLKDWLSKNKAIIKKWQEYLGKDCKVLYPNDINKQKECEQIYANALKVNNFVNSIQKNIEILEKYRNLPLQLYQYVHLVDFYVSQLMCIINKYLDMVVGWLNRNSLIFEKWVDAIITIINTIKTWQILIDISVNWKTTCGKCRADNGDLYDCTLSGLCPDLPVLPIPPFKIPDIFIDFSHVNLGLNVVLPKIKINPVPVGLFTLPDLPYPSLSIEIPSIPLLPQPPELPSLPALPAVPTVELPNLPPPPLIPQFMPSLEGALNIFKIVGYFWCIIKNGIGLVAEWNVKSRIEQLTARTNRLFPFDFLTVEFPVLPWKGFDIKVDSYLNYNVKFDQLYQVIKTLVDPINKVTLGAADAVLQFNYKWNQKASEYNNSNFNLEIKPGAFNFKSDKIPTNIAKAYLAYQLQYLLSQKNANYLKSIPDSIFARAYKVLTDLNISKVSPNYKGIEKLRNQVDKVFTSYKKELKKIDKQIKNIGSGNISSIKLTDASVQENKNYKFYVSLFNTDKTTKNLIKNENIRKDYLQMYGKVLSKLSAKLAKYESKPTKKYLYQQEKIKVDSLLKVINSTGYNYPLASVENNNPVMVDPTQFIKGLYVEGTDGTYYNVLADKEKAYKTREENNYVFADLNADSVEDLIYWDNYNVYVKYTDDEPKPNGINYTQTYIYPETVKKFADIVDKNGFVEIVNTEFKIWDTYNPVDDLQSFGGSYEKLSLRWTSNPINAYLIEYSSRIDVLNDLQKKFNYANDFSWAGKNYKTYGVVLYDSSLGKINELTVSKIIFSSYQPNYTVFVPVDNLSSKTDLLAVLNKTQLLLPNKWKYFRIFKGNLSLQTNTFTILSTYSNQDVGGEQLIGDDQAPEVKISLWRNEVNKVDEGTSLQGYINTNYVLKVQAKDNVAIKEFKITDENYNLITTGDTLKLFEIQPTTKNYHIIAIDWNDNKVDIPVSIEFKVPKIHITNVNLENGSIIAKISTDMDKTAIEFYVIKNGEKVLLKSITGKQVFTGSTGKIIFTGSIFQPNKDINLYDKKGKIIGKIDLSNSIIKVNPGYEIYGVSSGGLLINQVGTFEGDLFYPLFNIYIPSEKLVTKPTLYDANKFEIKEFIGVSSLGEFANSYCLFNKLDKTCAIYIQKNTGKIYINPNYNFGAKYEPNELGIVTYVFYNIPIVDKQLLNTASKIFTVSIKPKNLVKTK